MTKLVGGFALQHLPCKPMAQMQCLRMTCPAKVNLTLSVGAPDATHDGMHPIASLMVALRFADYLMIEQTNGPSRFEIAFSGASAETKVDWPLEEDLAYRAHELLVDHTGRELPVRLILTKHIPPAAGLGGGSTNAATTLIGLDRMFDLQLGAETLTELAGQLGSDVPYLVGAKLGRPFAMVSGFGETVTPVTMRKRIQMVLIFPPFGCATGRVYRQFDTLVEPTKRADAARAAAPTKQQRVLPDAPFNDLTDAACRVQPRLGELIDKLRMALDMPVHVTGTGSALFIIRPHTADINAMAARVRDITALPALATSTT